MLAAILAQPCDNALGYFFLTCSALASDIFLDGRRDYLVFAIDCISESAKRHIYRRPASEYKLSASLASAFDELLADNCVEWSVFINGFSSERTYVFIALAIRRCRVGFDVIDHD